MAFVSKKCPRCRGCMEYKKFDRLYLYCEFCDRLYYRIPGGELIKKEITDENRYKFGLQSLD